MTKQHTPEPWTVEIEKLDDAEFVYKIRGEAKTHVASINSYFSDERPANAAFIVRACNSHEQLEADNKRLREALQGLFAEFTADRTSRASLERGNKAAVAARAALASAREDKI